MRYCIQCNKIETMCGCISPTIVNQTTINSDAAGRDGLSAYDIAVRTGKFTGTESEFADWTKGQKGDKGDKGDQGIPGASGSDGQQEYERTDW